MYSEYTNFLKKFLKRSEQTSPAHMHLKHALCAPDSSSIQIIQASWMTLA